MPKLNPAILAWALSFVLVCANGAETLAVEEQDGFTGDNKESLTEVLAKVADQRLGKRLAPGNGFWIVQGEKPLQWKHLSTQASGHHQWEFRYESSQNLQALTSLELKPEYDAAVYQVTLTNTGSAKSEPFTRLWALYLRIQEIVSTPRVMSSAGGNDARHYPPTTEHGSFWTRHHLFQYPHPATPLEFGSPPGERGSSTRDLPIIMVSPDIEFDAPGFIFGMEWSSSWKAEIRYDEWANDPKWGSESRYNLVVAEGPEVRDLVLEPGESLKLPAVHIVFFDNGFSGGTNASRRYIRECVTPRYDGKLVVPPAAYTIWPGIMESYTDKDLYPQIDALASMGVEMFIIDDAWYPGNFPRGCGNWYPDPAKFPSGLEPVAEYVKSKGMGLGLFIDGEAEPGTKMLVEHPEFFYKAREVRSDQPEGRALLAFSQKEACDYMIDLVSDLIERYDLRYLRWDQNIDADEVLLEVDPTMKVNFAHFYGLYYVWETLLRKYPKLMLEVCCGGGRQLDLGTMKTHHTGWSNDNMSHPHIYHTMQAGGNSFFPANYLGSSLGWPVFRWFRPEERPDAMRHPDAALSDLSFLSRMAGEFFLHGRVADWPADAQTRGRHWIGVYKKVRHLLTQDYYRLLPQPQSEADWNAMQFCHGKDEGVVFVFRWAGSTDNQHLLLQSLDRGSSYRFRDEGTGKEESYSGEQLMAEGFRVEMNSDSAKLFSYRIQ